MRKRSDPGHFGPRAVWLAALLILPRCGNPELTEPGPDVCLSIGSNGVVELEAGPFRGHRAGATCAFKGIPYAQPPLGSLRFRAPEKAVRSSALRDARDFGSPCPQVDLSGAVSGSEDCLTLNVWAPPSEPEQPLPVAVFFHGGGNVAGFSGLPIYDGRELAARGGLLVVTANYRLGALGYLAHSALSAETEPPSSGNYGLLDQIAVLEWVRDNAGALGGDPSRVLAFGQSAGARNLCALSTSPRSSSLFDAAILQSGACELEPLAAKVEFGADVARAAGCSDGADVAACLRGLRAQRLITVQPSLPSPLDTSDYNPNIDGWLVPAPPRELLATRAGEPAVMVGNNAAEVGHIAPQIASEEGYERWLTTLYGADLAAQILARYPASAYPDPRAALVQVVNDARYECPARRTARSAAAGGVAFRFLFARGLDHGAGASFGAYHGLELLFVFRSFEAAGHTPSESELALSDAMIDAYSRFAHTGSPDGGRIQIPRYEPPSEPYARIASVSSVERDFGTRECDFWETLAP